MEAMHPRLTNFSTGGVYVDQDADDLALVARCRVGEAAAFEALVERYQRVLFSVALRMLGDYDAASDAAQNAFVKAYQKLDTFDPTRRFFSWIYRILVNECLNARRDSRPYEPIPPDLAADGTPADLFETAERRKRVQAAILALPMEYREVMVLRHFTELSYEEIGEALHVPAKKGEIAAAHGERAHGRHAAGIASFIRMLETGGRIRAVFRLRNGRSRTPLAGRGDPTPNAPAPGSHRAARPVGVGPHRPYPVPVLLA